MPMAGLAGKKLHQGWMVESCMGTTARGRGEAVEKYHVGGVWDRTPIHLKPEQSCSGPQLQGAGKFLTGLQE